LVGVGYEEAHKLVRYDFSGDITKDITERVVWGVPMRFNSERRIREAWRIVASGLEQWE
jgi:hypothetical protein